MCRRRTLAGLWDLPRFQVKPAGQGVGGEIIESVQRLTGVLVTPEEKLTTIKHGVTRFRITLTCYSADYVSGLNLVNSPLASLDGTGAAGRPSSKRDGPQNCC